MDKIKARAEREHIFKMVYGVDNLTDIIEMFQEEYRGIKDDPKARKEINSLFQRYVLAITYLYPSSSIKANLTRFRNVISKEGGMWEEETKYTFYIYDVWRVATLKTEASRSKREKVNKELVFDVSSEIKRIREQLENDAFQVARNQNKAQVRSYNIAYMLGLSTGRRFTEIFKTLEVEGTEEEPIFKGLLKKQFEEEGIIKGHIIVLTRKELISYLGELRDYVNNQSLTKKGKPFSELSEKEVNATFSKNYNNAIKRLTNNRIPNFHQLRNYYTISSQKTFIEQNPYIQDMGEDEKEDLLKSFRFKILGHHVGIDTTRTYTTVK